jgi:isocitrate dehydrogenase (NAD+)
MAKYTVVTMPGDGIGNQILPEALRLLKAVGFDASYVHGDIGWECWRRHGNALPDSSVDLLAKHKLALVGAITSKPKEVAEAELRPELKGKGYSYFNPLVSMLQRLHLDMCVRPCISFSGNPLNFIRRGRGSGLEEPALNVVVFLQSTDVLYAVEWTDPPEEVRAALGNYRKFREFVGTGPDLAISLHFMNRAVARKLCRAAFEWTKQYDYKSVTICETPKVLRENSGMLHEEANAIAKEYPEIALRLVNIDAAATWLTNNPENFGVVVASDGFGDFISDTLTAFTGGPGFAASGNLGDDCAVFKPAQGSASKYAELDPPIVNPIAMFLSAVMLLEHIGEAAKAKRIRDAVAAVIKEGKVRTYDMMRIVGGDKAICEGAASTYEMTDAVLTKLTRESSALPPEYATLGDGSQLG